MGEITVKTVKPGERSLQVIEGEIQSYRNLLYKRRIWLESSTNK
jgi:hypothetical protein